MTKSELLKVAKPILFNTEMVQAILEGKKTVTRRVIKPQPRENLTYPLGWSYATHKKGKFGWGKHECGGVIDTAKPRYYKNDILYVRETFNDIETDTILYAADEEFIDFGCKRVDDYLFMESEIKWKPSIHMPKTAARIFLKVTDVRAERLQEITTDECRNEGCCSSDCLQTGRHSEDCKCDTRFMNTWDSTIKKQDLDKYSWEANPWVWVYEFERIEI